jgi:hypothetical protein
VPGFEMRSSPFVRLALAGMIPVMIAGCASTKLWKSDKNDFDKAGADNPAVKTVCLWQAAEGRGLDDLPTRGFTGQILFLTQDSPMPVEVDGDVTIYVFDDQGSVEEQTKPLHQFNFRGGAWQNYLNVTAWGPTYQIFIPYTRKGDSEAKCELRVRLTPNDGPTVFSDPAKIWLPGSKTEANVQVRPRPPDRQPELLEVSHVAPEGVESRQTRDPGLDPHQNPSKKFESYTVPQGGRAANQWVLPHR